MLAHIVVLFLLLMLALSAWGLRALWRSRAEARRALAAREAMQRVLADMSPHILWQADADGRVTQLSRAWTTLVGRRDGGWLGSRWFWALHPDDVAPTREAFAAASRAKGKMRLKRRLRNRDGHCRTFRTVAAPVLGADGSVERWIGMDTDITRLERHAGRLARLDDDFEALSYTMSHDLRTPVQVIKGFADAMLAGQAGSVDDAARSSVERVRRNAAQMDELMSDLLSLSSLSRETLSCERLDPLDVARSVALEVRPRYPDRVIEFQVRGAVVLSADRRLFQVLLESLIDNAVKFSPGPVCRVDVQARYERDDVVVAVADRGVGFPSELASRLFRPFQRLHENARFSGSGVGLATASRIVRLHGGNIEGRNRGDGGAVFEIRLPQQQPMPTTMPADLITEAG